jgi:trehalose/maltose hydrolase-like predicted phosphorylase
LPGLGAFDLEEHHLVNAAARTRRELARRLAGELTALLHRLGYDWSPRQLSDTIDYYLARTCDGSTLSTLVHAWVLARVHPERTLEQFIEALRTDLADIQGGTTAEGIHLAAMAGTIDVLQRCFAGIETRDDVLWLHTYWLQSLGGLELPILYRGHVITRTVADHTVLMHDGPGNLPPVRVGYSGQVHELGPGQTLGFPLGQAAADAAATPLA